MSHPLLLAHERATMRVNGERLRQDPAFDPPPVVRLSEEGGPGRWLLTALDPQAPTRAFGLCAAVTGRPTIGWVDLLTLAARRGPGHRPVERDPHFVARYRLSTYAARARAHDGRTP